MKIDSGETGIYDGEFGKLISRFEKERLAGKNILKKMKEVNNIRKKDLLDITAEINKESDFLKERLRENKKKLHNIKFHNQMLKTRLKAGEMDFMLVMDDGVEGDKAVGEIQGAAV